MKEYQIAFVGNPNVGKSAWINALADAHFKVGNWPGVTVAKKEARLNWQGTTLHFIDLPGTYSLIEQANEEGITAHFLHHESVDLIVNVVDATNLSRNLYLTLCLRQLQIPMIVIFNFMDEVKRYHIEMDIDAIQDQLGIPIYPYSAFDVDGKAAVLEGILAQLKDHSVYYPPMISERDEVCYRRLLHLVNRQLPAYITMSEEKQELFAYDLLFQKPAAMRQSAAWHMDLSQLDLLEVQMEDVRLYEQIEDLMRHVHDDGLYLKRTRILDQVLLHPQWGIVIMVLMLSLLMLVVFQCSAPFNDFIDFLIHDMVMKYAYALLFFLPEAARELILHGVIAGVGGVLVFIPLMAFLHLALSFLEESGYMARIAYLLDDVMRLFHLNGKSFVALLLGFGCNVPAIYATRTLANEKQRRLSALLVPFMSCGARLPVYMLFAAAFFKGKGAVMVLSIYGIGILIALLLALILSHFASFADDEVFLMELPPYRKPSYRLIWQKAVQEVKNYVRKAVSVVMWAMIALWAMSYLPSGHLQDSYLAQAAQAIRPLYEPLGFGTRWECIAALPGSIVAKETVVGFMDQVLVQKENESMADIDPYDDAKQIIYAFGSTLREFSVSLIPHIQTTVVQDDHLTNAVSQLWEDDLANVRAYAYMVYILLSIPCIMTLQALRKEYGWKLMGLSLSLMLVIPYGCAWLIFQLFSLLV